MVEVNDMMSVQDVQEILAIPHGVIPEDERYRIYHRGEPLVLAENPFSWNSV